MTAISQRARSLAIQLEDLNTSTQETWVAAAEAILEAGLQEATKEKDAEIARLNCLLKWQGTLLNSAGRQQFDRAEQAEAALTEKDEALRAMTDSAERAYDAKCRAEAEIEELKGRIIALMGL